MLQQAEQFLINEVTKKYRSCSTFDELRAKQYHHQSNNKRFVDLPCSNNIRRAFLQTKLWLNVPFLNVTDTMDFQDYGCVCHLNENMILTKLSDDEVKPLDVPESCECTTFVKRTCSCRVAGLTCSVLCRCSDHEDKGCQNPHTKGTTTYNVVYFIMR